MVRVFNRRWMGVFAGFVVAVASVVSVGAAGAATGGVIVSNQNDCSVGPTNDNFLSSGETAYVWLIFRSSTSVRGYSYEVTGTSNPSDSGILKLRFNQCRKVNPDDWVAKFTTPTAPGGYTLTVFDGSGTKVSSDNFTIT
jgi:hypothetical protein